ncbi:hypothetical protein AVEN_138787-1, partial [Araneus ventricosus]
MYVGMVHVRLDAGSQTSSRWYGAEVWRWEADSGVVLFNGSKLRDQSQNTSLVAWKPDVNITKRNQTYLELCISTVHSSLQIE